MRHVSLMILLYVWTMALPALAHPVFDALIDGMNSTLHVTRIDRDQSGRASSIVLSDDEVWYEVFLVYAVGENVVEQIQVQKGSRGFPKLQEATKSPKFIQPITEFIAQQIAAQNHLDFLHLQDHPAEWSLEKLTHVQRRVVPGHFERPKIVYRFLYSRIFVTMEAQVHPHNMQSVSHIKLRYLDSAQLLHARDQGAEFRYMNRFFRELEVAFDSGFNRKDSLYERLGHVRQIHGTAQGKNRRYHVDLAFDLLSSGEIAIAYAQVKEERTRRLHELQLVETRFFNFSTIRDVQYNPETGEGFVRLAKGRIIQFDLRSKQVGLQVGRIPLLRKNIAVDASFGFSPMVAADFQKKQMGHLATLSLSEFREAVRSCPGLFL